MKYVRLFVIFLFLNVTNPILNEVNAEENGLYQSISFPTNSPLEVNNSTIVSGFVSSSEISIMITWQLESSNVILDNGQLTLDFPSESLQNPTYQWEIFLDFPSYGNYCTCYLTVTLESEFPQTITKPIFYSPNEHIFNPAFILSKQSENNLYSDIIPIYGSSWSQNGFLPDVHWNIFETNSNAASCDVEISQILSNSIKLISPYQDSNTFHSSLDISNLNDGYYSLYTWSNIFIESEQLNSKIHCSFVQIDNNAPSSEIQAQNNLVILEGFDPILFDGSISTDPFFGRAKLNFVWVLSQIVPNINDDNSHMEVRNVTSGSDERTFLIDDLNSGNYTLILTVTDECGLSNSSSISFSIVNMAPIARLSINQLEVFNGESIELLADEELELDASESSDTENDIGSLRCIWKVNNVPFYEGCVRTFSWPNSVESNEFTLSLEVSDNDDLISQISLIITSDTSRNNTYFALMLLLFSLIFVSYGFYKRYSVNEEKIPKW